MARTKWPEFSRRLLKYYEVPRGFTIGLYHPDGRKARTNMSPDRKTVKEHNLPELDNRKTVAALCAAAQGLFPEGSKVLDLEWRLFDIRGERILGGKSLGKVREMEGEPTEAEKEEEEIKALRIEELTRHASGHLRDAEELEDDPHQTVPQAYVDALVDRYGVDPVHEALAKHVRPSRGRR